MTTAVLLPASTPPSVQLKVWQQRSSHQDLYHSTSLRAAAPTPNSTQAETLTCALTARGQRSPKCGQCGGLDNLQALAVAGDEDTHVEAPRDWVLNVGFPSGEQEAIQELQATVPAFGEGVLAAGRI